MRPGEMGGEKQVKIDIETASMGERWRSIGDRSGVREKNNERSEIR